MTVIDDANVFYFVFSWFLILLKTRFLYFFLNQCF